MDADISLRTASQKCFCCGYITLRDPPAGEICPLCDREDDALPEHLIEELGGGANHGLLNSRKEPTTGPETHVPMWAMKFLRITIYILLPLRRLIRIEGHRSDGYMGPRRVPLYPRR